VGMRGWLMGFMVCERRTCPVSAGRVVNSCHRQHRELTKLFLSALDSSAAVNSSTCKIYLISAQSSREGKFAIFFGVGFGEWRATCLKCKLVN
jgi:hypothetical protein